MGRASWIETGSGKRGKKIGIHESGRRGKKKLDEVQKASSKRHKSGSSVAKQSTKKLEICDLDPLPVEMAMPYMIQVQYKKPVLPDRSHGEKRKGGSIHRSVHRVGTSTKPSNSRMKQSIPMLLITDGRLGHSDLPIDDDDFVDAPPSWKGTLIHEDSPSGERIHVIQVVDELRNYFKGQISDLQSKNRLLSKQLQAMQSQVSSLKSNQQKKLKLLVRMQGCKSRKSVGSKGKAKVDSACAVEFPCSIEPPYFDLGLGFIQPNQFVAKTSKKVEVQVESVISNVLRDMECIEQEHSPKAAPSSGLPMKRAPKLVKALQSPYVVEEMKQMKSSGNVVVFKYYNQNVQDADVADFQNWFQRGYKLHNKEVSLTSSHMDVCFYYICQVARSARDLKFVATTTDS
ncbi:Hypothetical predicted protein [Olea europaea subsp. europaea]|uniref:Uncharacterized protein n=1 Tax=Olea europaea subsp. europaea TaxID=158383 RepID=A0A8S0PXU2_OLEEU|nr:Hypothetical predicted protein [Olea europaea subsp. europaea]